MTYTIEDIQRLVPEDYRLTLMQMLKPDARPSIGELARAFLTTRVQLEVAVEYLERISNPKCEGSDILADEALAKLKEME